MVNKRAFFVLFLIVATELIGFGLIIPILPQIAQKFQSNGPMLGFLLGSYSLAQFLASPLLGNLSDKYGRKPVLVLSKLGTVLSYVMLAFSFNYWWFLAARLLDGFTGGNIAVARAYAADITSPKDRAKGMAIIGISFGTGFVLGPALGGYLYGVSSTHTIPALVSGALSLLAMLFTVVLLKEPESRHSNDQKVQFSNIRHLLGYLPMQATCLIYLIFMIVFSGFETTFSVFTHRNFGYSEQQNSYMFLYIGILAMLIQGGIMRRPFKKLTQGVLLGLVATAVSLYMLSAAGSETTLYIALAVLALGVGLIQTHLPALLSNCTDDSQTGQVMGIYESIGSLSRIIGPMIIYSGYYYALRSAYLLYTMAILTAGIVIVSTTKRLTRQP